MRSGFPHSQGGAYSAFQCRSNVGVLPSPQDISTAPVPVVQPENGIQNNMVATQYPGELRVAHTPAKLKPGYSQSQQNFQELHHHQESQANKVSTGLQHPLPTDSKYTSWNSHHQISREDNAEFHTSVHVSKQCSSYSGTLVNENSVRQSVYNGGKQRECHRQNFSRHSLKGSNLNKNPGLRQRHLNSASSPSTIATESCPLLPALQKGNDSDSKYSTTSSSSSEETNANSEVITITNLSDGRHCKAQQVKQQVMFPFPSSQSSTENVHPVRKTKPPTDDDILDFVHKSIAEYQTILTQKNIKYEHSNKDSDRVYSPQPDSIMPKVNSVAHLPTTSAPDKEDVEWQSLNCAVTEQYTAAVGQELEEDSSKGSKTNAEFTNRVKETGDCATSASERHSTGKLVSAVESSKCAAKIEPVESASGEEAFSMNTVKNLLYEDIQPATKPPNPEHVEVSFPARSENPMYEDVSEDESQQMEDIAGETLSHTQAPEHNVKQSLFENDSYYCATSASEKNSSGTLAFAVENSKHAAAINPVESASVDFNLSVKKHLDVIMPANGNCKLVYSDDCDYKALVDSNDKSFYSKWCYKYLKNGMATLQYSLTALKELIASLESVETIAEMENFSEVILQQFWNGNIDNIHLFTSTEYQQIMREVAFTCTKNEDESRVVLTSMPGMTLDDLTEKQTSLTLNCSMSQEQNNSLWSNSKDLDTKVEVPDDRERYMPERQSGALKLVEAEGLDSVQRRAGLGYFPKIQVSKARGKERHQLLQEEVRAGMEEEQVCRAVGLWQQGKWTGWESTLQCKVTWSNIMQADFHRIRFLVQAVYDALPSPANLHVWGKSETPSYLLCGSRGSLEHLLSNCPKALAYGRYLWRHDQVFKAVAESVALAISTSKHHHSPKKAILFIKDGEKP
uniref:uncharacterized protein LOC117249646 n=1 Tax=Epinephelus lanceolatus TaxID=310571 RepID=UPI001446A2FA|nr:uncharacterized protein LOC117249646 [Epinephelus lanceolatus]